jgi:cytochrome c
MCVENAIKGKALDPKSDQMKDLVAYIKSLKGKAAAKTKKTD